MSATDLRRVALLTATLALAGCSLITDSFVTNEFSGDPFPINAVPTQLGLCTPAQASTGLAAYTDGAPSNAINIQNRFPYLNAPLRGSPRPQTQP